MKLKDVKGTPFDYSDDKIKVYFKVASMKKTKEIFESIDFIDEIEEVDHGFELNIAIQQIPEVIRNLSLENIAIYGVIPKK